MSHYELFIPSSVSPPASEKAFQLETSHWMAAVRMGMGELEGQGSAVQNILADIHSDGSLHVTEARTGRVFRVRVLVDEDLKRARPKSAPYQKRLDPAVMAASVMSASSSISSLPSVGLPYRSTATPFAQMEGVRTDASTAQGHAQRSISHIVELETPIRPVSSGTIGRAGRSINKSEEIDVFADAFERVVEVPSGATAEEALYFFLDLAIKEIPVAAGSIMRADSASSDLRFAAVRGPRAKQILESEVVVTGGEGIVGFCLRESVSVALSDIQIDNRFHPGITESMRVEVASVLCAPIANNGRVFGCIELINRQKSPEFQKYEMGVLSYIAHRLALHLAA